MALLKIESLIKRDPPTVVTLGHKTYQFAPDEHGRHVIDVDDQEHLARFLSIPEGYRLVVEGSPIEQAKPLEFNASSVAAVAVPPKITTLIESVPERDDRILIGSDVHPSLIELDNGEQVQLGTVVQGAFEASGLTIPEWNALDEDDRHQKIDDQLDVLNGLGKEPEGEGGEGAEGGEGGEGGESGESAAPAGEASTLDREALAQQYEAKFGSRPNGRMGAEKILAAINKPA